MGKICGKDCNVFNRGMHIVGKYPCVLPPDHKGTCSPVWERNSRSKITSVDDLKRGVRIWQEKDRRIFHLVRIAYDNSQIPSINMVDKIQTACGQRRQIFSIMETADHCEEQEICTACAAKWPKCAALMTGVNPADNPQQVKTPPTIQEENDLYSKGCHRAALKGSGFAYSMVKLLAEKPFSTLSERQRAAIVKICREQGVQVS